MTKTPFAGLLRACFRSMSSWFSFFVFVLFCLPAWSTLSLHRHKKNTEAVAPLSLQERARKPGTVCGQSGDDLTPTSCECCECSRPPLCNDFDDEVEIMLDKNGYSHSALLSPSNWRCGNVGVNLAFRSSGGKQCQTAVKVVDGVSPNVECRSSLTLVLDQWGRGTVETIAIGNSSDACGLSREWVDRVFFSCDDLAATPVAVTYMAEDVNGNRASCNASVTILDKLPPELRCFNVSVLVGKPLDSSITGLWVLDNCARMDRISISFSPPVFDCAAVGAGPQATAVTVTDDSGNSAECRFYSTVLMPKLECNTSYSLAVGKAVDPNLVAIASCPESLIAIPSNFSLVGLQVAVVHSNLPERSPLVCLVNSTEASPRPPPTEPPSLPPTEPPSLPPSPTTWPTEAATREPTATPDGFNLVLLVPILLSVAVVAAIVVYFLVLKFYW